MGRKLTTEEIIYRCSKIFPNYDYSSLVYIPKKKFKIICPEHGEFEKSLETMVYRKEGCPKCNGFLSSDLILEKINLTKYTLIDDENLKMHNTYIFNCPEHKEFIQTPYKLLKNGCPKCKGYNKTIDEIINELNKIHFDRYEYIINSFSSKSTFKSKIKIICPEHGEFENILQNHYHKKSGCPKCKMSKGETFLMNILKEFDIKHVTQKSFQECRNKNKLPFDFYLPDYNTCIEYDGKQHFEEVEFFGGQSALLKTQENDLIKTNYCIENNIKLIRIKYNQSEKDIRNIIWNIK